MSLRSPRPKPNYIISPIWKFQSIFGYVKKNKTVRNSLEEFMMPKKGEEPMTKFSHTKAPMISITASSIKTIPIAELTKVTTPRTAKNKKRQKNLTKQFMDILSSNYPNLQNG